MEQPVMPCGRGSARQGFQAGDTAVFETAPGDARIGEVADGPVIVARAGQAENRGARLSSGAFRMRYELAAPLLFANLLRWISPEIFRRWEMAAGSVGTVKVELDADVPAQAK